MAGWINRYDFAYASHDTANTGLATFNTLVFRSIENAANQADGVVENKIQQAIQQGGIKLKELHQK